MGYYVYIIEPVTGLWYYGYSAEPERRLIAHNAGYNGSTHGLGPWELIFKRRFELQIEALAFEKLLKKTRNKKYIYAIYQEYFID
jgi:predicted GIY-YIG superfamily endonuclease